MHVLTIANFKGGVGKTTTSVTLAHELTTLGERVLLIDWDPQANATLACGVDRWDDDAYLAQDLIQAPDRAFEPAALEAGLDLLPTNPLLQELEYLLHTRAAPNLQLRRSLGALDNRYDQVVIDTGPSMGRMLFNALCAAQLVIVPVRLEVLSLSGLKDLLSMIKRAQAEVEGGAKLLGFLGVDKGRGSAYDERLADLREAFGDLVFQAVIPRRVAISDAFRHGQPITRVAPNTDGAEAYRRFAKEVLDRVSRS